MKYVWLLGLVLAGCAHKPPQTANPEAIPVRVQEVHTDQRPSGNRYSATVEPATRVKLTFNASGYVDSIRQVADAEGGSRWIQAGDRVRTGEVLARLRSLEHRSRVSQAQAQFHKARAAGGEAAAVVQGAEGNRQVTVQQHAESQAAFKRLLAMAEETDAAYRGCQSLTKEAQIQVRLATLDFERAKKLFEGESLIKPDYDKSWAQLEVARQKLRQAQESERQADAKRRQAGAEVEAGRARIAQASAQVSVAESQIARGQAALNGILADADGARAVLEQANLSLDDASLKAPFEGTVVSRQIEVGAQVGPGVPAFDLADLRFVRVVFGVPDLEVEKLKLARRVKILAEALPDKNLEGKITTIATEADLQSRVYKVEVKVDNRAGLLKVGMIATLDLSNSNNPTSKQLSIPLTALARSKDGSKQYHVFVVEGEHAKARSIQVGEALEEHIVVLQGLREGEKVVTEGANQLADGDRVRVLGPSR